MSSSHRLALQAELWNRRARENAYVAILSDPSMLDPARRQAEFARSGQQAAAELAPWLFPGAEVLDLGVGLGRVALPVAPEVGRVLAVDISAEMLRQARGYLGSVANVELRETSGESLPDVEPGSVDLLWSLLCLIHTDKTTAWRYLLEIKRVLKPGAVARLQFFNSLSPEGLAVFLDTLDLPFPPGCYAPEELQRLVQAAGLEVLDQQVQGCFIDCTVVQGSAADWRRVRREGLRFQTAFSAAHNLGAALEIHRPLSWQTHWENQLPDWSGFRFAFRAIDPNHPGDGTQDHLRGTAVVRLPPRSRGTLQHTLRLEAPQCELTVSAGPALLSHLEFTAKPITAETPAELLVAFLPAGFAWDAAEAALWGQAAWQRPIKLVPRG